MSGGVEQVEHPEERPVHLGVESDGGHEAVAQQGPPWVVGDLIGRLGRLGGRPAFDARSWATAARYHGRDLPSLACFVGDRAGHRIVADGRPAHRRAASPAPSPASSRARRAGSCTCGRRRRRADPRTRGAPSSQEVAPAVEQSGHDVDRRDRFGPRRRRPRARWRRRAAAAALNASGSSSSGPQLVVVGRDGERDRERAVVAEEHAVLEEPEVAGDRALLHRRVDARRGAGRSARSRRCRCPRPAPAARRRRPRATPAGRDRRPFATTTRSASITEPGRRLVPTPVDGRRSPTGRATAAANDQPVDRRRRRAGGHEAGPARSGAAPTRTWCDVRPAPPGPRHPDEATRSRWSAASCRRSGSR